MPLIRTTEKPIGIGNRPDWSRVTSGGIFRVRTTGGRFDRHFHDCHEYWMVFNGKAKVLSEGREYYIKPGDILCTRAGDEHDILEVYEDLEAFWFEDETPAGGRIGHLHRTPDLAPGHPVPHKPIPPDFPA